MDGAMYRQILALMYLFTREYCCLVALKGGTAYCVQGTPKNTCCFGDAQIQSSRYHNCLEFKSVPYLDTALTWTIYNELIREIVEQQKYQELKGLGLNSCVALISEANRKKRLQFARDHKDWTLEQWKKVMWSDESRFTLYQSDGHIR
ncbi:hypothetical protein QTP86_026116, partial [Hemibagrus guttatus]